MQTKEFRKKVEFFINRKEELSNLGKATDFLAMGKPKNILILGYRRMGKTYIIWKHFSTIRKDVVPVYLDCLIYSSWEEVARALYKKAVNEYSAVKKDRMEALRFFLSERTTDAYDAIKNVEVKIGVENALYLKLATGLKKEKSPIEKLDASLRALEELGSKKKVAFQIALDEFQGIARFEGWKTGIAALRSRLQVTENVGIILSGSKPSFFKTHLLKKTKPFWKQLQTYEISPFTLEDIEEALKKRKMKVEWSKKILDYTKGVPDYVIKLMDELERGETVDNAFASLLTKETKTMEILLEDMTDLQVGVLKKIALGKRYSEIKKEIGREVSPTLRHLVEDGLIKKKKRGEYEVVDPLICYLLKQ